MWSHSCGSCGDSSLLIDRSMEGRSVGRSSLEMSLSLSLFEDASEQRGRRGDRQTLPIPPPLRPPEPKLGSQNREEERWGSSFAIASTTSMSCLSGSRVGGQTLSRSLCLSPGIPFVMSCVLKANLHLCQLSLVVRGCFRAERKKDRQTDSSYSSSSEATQAKIGITELRM